MVDAFAGIDETMTSGPRERALAEGVDALGDADLVALLLGTGGGGRCVHVLAASLLEDAGGVEGLARLGPHAIAAERGVGPAKALRLAAAFELGRRAHGLALRPRASVKSAAEVAAYAAARLAPLDHEQMWLFSLDGRNRLRSVRRVAQGGLHGCSVAARDILRAALADAASAIVLVHNHPSGDPAPSMEDVAMTRVVEAAAASIGVPLVDHVIVASDGRHASMLELGLLDPRE
ncbi:MAG TPA: DNA repair protein RadC [Byssovorax sp.]|jgi:DNA repair protein RadC